MSKLYISKNQLKVLVNEAMNASSTPMSVENDMDSPIEANPTVDPSAAETDPFNSNFVPQNKIEFAVAVNQLTKTIPATDLSKIFKTLQSKVADEEEKMNKNLEKNQVEEAIRIAVRKILNEMKLGGLNEEFDEEDLENSEEKKKKSYKKTAIGGMSDVEGKSFSEIADLLGFSVAGAKRAVDQALETLQWVAANIEPEELEIVILESMKEFIDLHEEAGHMSPENIQLLKDHPELMIELPLEGFQVFLAEKIKKMKKSSKKMER